MHDNNTNEAPADNNRAVDFGALVQGDLKASLRASLDAALEQAGHGSPTAESTGTASGPGSEAETEDGVPVGNPVTVVPSANSYAIAVDLLAKDIEAQRFMRYKVWRGTWYRYEGPHWAPVPSEELVDMLWHQLGYAVWYDSSAEAKPRALAPTENKLRDILSAMAAHLRVGHEHEGRTMFTPGAGVLGRDAGRAWNGISLANGLLDLDTREPSAHTPLLFNLDSRPFAYDASAGCPRWLAFLDSVFESDWQARELLQEWAGYLIAGRCEQEKILQLVGPSRAGKGTVRDVLKALVGPESTTESGLETLGGRFGLQNAIGKSLLVIPDAEQSKKITGTPVEILKSISGNDGVTIDRKGVTPWSGRLETRIMLVSNEFVKFHDPTGALHKRFLTISLTNSFAGREDKSLKSKLLEELPGIFNWALEGLVRLDARGSFVQPESAMEDLQDQVDAAAPMQAFLRDWCEYGNDGDMHSEIWKVSATELRTAWLAYCFDNGVQREHQSVSGFGRELKSGAGALQWQYERRQARSGRWYYGFRLHRAEDRREGEA